MQIDLTVRHGGTCTDVGVSVPGGATLADVAPALAAALGPDAGSRAGVELWSGTRRLAPTAALGSRGLRTGDVLHAQGPGAAHPAVGALALHRVGGLDAGGVLPVARGRLVIGRDRACDVVVRDPDASRRHAVLDVGSSAISLRDCGSTNGTWVDGARVGPGGSAVGPGQVIRIGDCSLMLRGPHDGPASLSPADDGTRRLSRAPRDVPTLSRREIALPERSSSTRPRGVQWVAALVPALAGGAIAWFTRSPQFLLFALLSPVMLVSTSIGDRLHWRRSRRRDAATYRQRRADADHAIAVGLAHERQARRSAAPDAAALAATAALPGSRLWERRRSDADLLQLRLGVTALPSALRVRTGAGVRPAGVVADVPFCVALRDGPLGVCGPPEIVDGVLRWLLCQLAALHSPADVELSLLLEPEAQARWRWARWLPHLDGRVATNADEWRGQVGALATEVTRRVGSRSGASGWGGPWHVLVIDAAIGVADIAGLSALLDAGQHGGISAICVATDEASLPTTCTAVARVGGTTGTRMVVRRSTAQPGAGSGSDSGIGAADVVVDTVDAGFAETLARNLASISDAGSDLGAAVPASCTLLDVLGLPDPGAAAITRRWATCDGGARTVIGLGGDGPMSFDLVRDGPHALVAGTTGAGKSELLQTMVAGLAAAHPPEAVSFLLIDYKGGAAFADCARLPHTAGLVTDLDGYLTERALRSLHSELRRRERLFAQHGAVDLAAYRAGATVGDPLPRLVIVVDEFATLAEELPDFVHGLIGVAQRGRSLGVHLVLATQRPRSAVSAEIRANTALRVALRVTDAGESGDVIDTAEAAGIDPRSPGRAYLRSGTGLTCFQTAHAGAPVAASRGVTVHRLDPWRRAAPGTAAAEPGGGELTALVDAVRAAAQRSGRRQAARPWLPALPPAIPVADLDPRADPRVVRIALVDLPDEQRQATLDLDLRRGPSLLIVGGPRSGRSCALAAIALDAATRLAPDELHLYVVDPAGALHPVLRRLPHTATLVGGDDDATPVRTLLRRLTEQCTDPGARDTNGAVQLLLVDSWEALATSLGDTDAAECADLLTGLLRVGPSAGLSVVVAGGRACLTPRFAGHFAMRVLLTQTDRNDFGLAGISARDVPRTMPPGRGLRADDGAVLQIAHAGSSPDLLAAQQVADDLAARWGRSAHARSPAIRIRALPRRITAAQLSSDPAQPARPGTLVLGVGGDGAEPLAVDVFAGARQLLVAGPPRSGRSTALRVLLDQATRRGLAVLVAAGARSPLVSAAGAAVRVIDPHDAPDAIGAPPGDDALLLVDDFDLFTDTVAGETLLSWIRAPAGGVAAVVAGRADDFATSYRGLGAQVRRSGCGLLLRPGPVDGEILGVRLPRRPRSGPPGRGVLIGDPAWGPPFTNGEALPVQVVLPDASLSDECPTISPCAGNDGRWPARTSP